MLRLKRSSLFYFLWIAGILAIVTTFFYLPHLRDPRDHNLVLNDIKLSNEIQSRLTQLESGLKDNRVVLDELREKIEKLYSESLYTNPLELRDSGTCANVPERETFNDTLENILASIPFDNPDGGAWKQGWDIQVDNSRWNATRKLKVFVVPHSHNDPGWLKTFDQYLAEHTRHILNNVLKKLSENPSYSFIWAETSYFAAWWSNVKSEDDRELVKTLLDNGQLEIVTGGWVMNDEASTHYAAMIAQMVDGHEFLRNTLNYRPRHGWAIDPFGLSPTMGFLLKKMGFKAMVIQRVHYSIKKYLAQNHLLEFRWKQYWETDHSPSILCHVQPFYSYDIPHTCGPDPKVCCQFDFKRLPPTRIGCPWKIPPQRISAANVAVRASMLADQYMKKATLYKTDSLLVPLGDDFRWDKLAEWENQFSNYQKLFEYINSNMDIEIKWGTLKDYFDSIPIEETFPSLNGDFFTYADRDDNYWSGYFTTRPFHKSMDRMLESYVRSAEIIFSLGSILSEVDKPTKERLSEKLTYARLNLDLFQHHDGITGTSKNAVLDDYSLRLFNSFQKCQEIITTMASLLLHFPSEKNVPLTPIDVLPNRYLLPLQDILKVNDDMKSYFVIFNSLAMDRDELVCLAIPQNFTNWIIRDPSGKMIEEVQINRVYEQRELLSDVFEACFIAHLKPISLAQYTLESSTQELPFTYESSQITVYNFDSIPSREKEFEIGTENIKLIFNVATGSLSRSDLHSNDLFKSLNITINFMTYGTRHGNQEKSGAYLFLPDSQDAQNLPIINPPIRVIRGSIMTYVEVLVENELKLRHRITLFKGQKYFDIENEFQMVKGSFDNQELLMRFTSKIKNGAVFFTDLNSLQMVKRTWYDKIPLQGNVYPLPSLGYIEDRWTRLSILSAQPLGATSSHPGNFDVFLDRRLLQDDNRGVGQGITDNRRTRERFRIFVEQRPTESLKPSNQVQKSLLRLLNPVHQMQSIIPSNQGELNEMPTSLPCDVHLVNFRTNLVSFNEFHLFLHRFASSCEAQCKTQSFKLLPHLSSNLINALQPSVSSMSLSLLDEIKSNLSLHDLSVEMDTVDFSVYALRLK